MNQHTPSDPIGANFLTIPLRDFSGICHSQELQSHTRSTTTICGRPAIATGAEPQVKSNFHRNVHSYPLPTDASDDFPGQKLVANDYWRCSSGSVWSTFVRKESSNLFHQNPIQSNLHTNFGPSPQGERNFPPPGQPQLREKRLCGQGVP